MTELDKEGRAQMQKFNKKPDAFVYYISVPMNLRTFCLLLQALYLKMECGGLTPENFQR